MKEFLKGNYKLDVEIKETEDAEASRLETEFERKALSRLGGSICFVSKKNFVWTGEAQPEAGRAAASQGGETRRAGTPDRQDP